MNALVFAIAAAAATLVLPAPPAAAQDAYPFRPIRIVVPFPPGGTTDVLARIVGAKMQESMGQPVVIDNRPGAGGNVGAESVAKASPDGYTLLLGTPGPLAINPSLFKSMSFRPERDFAPIGQMITLPAVAIVLPASPLRTLSDVLAAARSQGRLGYASPGNGTTPHLAAELLASIAGVELQHVPSPGDAQALGDLLGGHVPLMFANIAGVAAPLREGKVRALAITGATRSRILPDVPTFAEAGIQGFSVTAWAGLAAPASTPPAVVARLNAELNKALAAPDVVERMRTLSAEIATGTPEQMAALMRLEQERWARTIQERRITLD
ncbi:MAG: tripartite tricarboxylate transporter substrate binding protein [Burkholderiales bacterium]